MTRRNVDFDSEKSCGATVAPKSVLMLMVNANVQAVANVVHYSRSGSFTKAMRRSCRASAIRVGASLANGSFNVDIGESDVWGGKSGAICLDSVNQTRAFIAGICSVFTGDWHP